MAETESAAPKVSRPVLLGSNIEVEVPGETHVFYDSAVHKIILVSGNTRVRAVSSPPTLYMRHGLRSIAYDTETPLDITLPNHKTPILTCPRVSLDFSWVAVIRSSRVVEMVSTVGTVPPYLLKCKASKEPVLIFDCGWAFVDTLFLVTSQTLELYTHNPGKRSLFKLVKSTSLAVHWHVYSHMAKVVLLATNQRGTVFQPYLIKPDGLVKLPKLKMAAKTGATHVSPSDVHLVVVYHKVFVLHVNAPEGCVALYHINREEAALRAELPIARGCTHKVSVVDQLIVLHNLERGDVLVYDIKVSCRSALDTPRDIVGSAVDAPDPTVVYKFASLDSGAAASSGGSGATAEAASGWLFFEPDLMMDLGSGRVYSLLLELSVLASKFVDGRRRVAFLLKREHCKVLVLHTLREMIWAKEPLHGIGQVFDMINEICDLAERERIQSELAELHAAEAAASKRSKRSWTSWFSSSGAGANPGPGRGLAQSESAIRGPPSGAGELGAKYSERGGTIPLTRVPSPAEPDLFDSLVRSSLASSSSSQLVFAPPLGASGAGAAAGGPETDRTAVSPLLVTERTRDGYAIIEQKEIYSFVLASMVEENKDLSVKYKTAVLMEYIRSLSTHGRPVAHYLYELVIALLVTEGKYHQLHQLIQYHVVSDSTPVALQLLSLDSVYPPAFQLALDMLKRLHTNEDIVEVLLSRGAVLPALRFIREHGFRSVPVARFLKLALESGDTPLFHTVFTFFAQRNLYLRGSEAFLPEEGCDEYVAAFARLYEHEHEHEHEHA